jgi:hypothetical protein
MPLTRTSCSTMESGSSLACAPATFVSKSCHGTGLGSMFVGSLSLSSPIAIPL